MIFKGGNSSRRSCVMGDDGLGCNYPNIFSDKFLTIAMLFFGNGSLCLVAPLEMEDWLLNQFKYFRVIYGF
jgi:hypothetical protein